MRHRRTLAALLLAIAAAGTSWLLAEEIWVSITTPGDGEFVMGEVEVEADVVAAGTVAEVEFFVDGRPVGVITASPYRMAVDLGDENLPHVFRVVARDTRGNEASHSVRTQPVPINAELELELQQLYVTVTDDGRRVLGLEAEDFTVVDEGDVQEIVTFGRGEIPFTAALLIDASASMFGEKLAAATAGARAFVRGMQELDQAKVLVFSDRILNSTPFASSFSVLSASLSAAHARGGTALNDHLFMALKLLEARQGRRLVVLLSDGIDSHSVLTMESVTEKALHSQAMVYWVRMHRQRGQTDYDESSVSLSSAWRGPAEYRSQLEQLERAVRDSGGKTVDVVRVAQIEPIFVEILRELREQYVLGYYPSNSRNDGRWHKVRVKVERPGLKVRTHEGYLDL